MFRREVQPWAAQEVPVRKRAKRTCRAAAQGPGWMEISRLAAEMEGHRKQSNKSRDV